MIVVMSCVGVFHEVELIPFNYISEVSTDFELILGFKINHGQGNLKFELISGKEVMAVRETIVDHNIKFIKIPFVASKGRNLSLHVLNIIDTQNINIVFQGFGINYEKVIFNE